MDNYIEQYLKCITEYNFEDAEILRLDHLPSKVYKFIPLFDEDNDKLKSENEIRINTIKNNKLWFSKISELNDPYECAALFLNREEMEKRYGFEVSEIYKEAFNYDDLCLCSLTKNDYDRLDMWSYYANNSKGFCVEYSVVKRNAIHEVLYLQKRIPFTFDVERLKKELINGMNGRTDYLNAQMIILFQGIYAKNICWSHEKEIRIVQSYNGSELGKYFSADSLGLRINRVIAGINCSSENKEKLNVISNQLGCGNILCSKTNDTNYGLSLAEYVS